MPQTIENSEGASIEVYTKEEKEAEMAAAVAAAKEEVGKTVTEKEAEIANLRKVSAEKTENFKKYNDLTEEERKAFDANTVTIMKRADKLEEELTQTKTSLAEKEQKERDYNKNSILRTIHSDDAKIKASIDEAYGKLNMPETTPDEIRARAEAAARLAGISVQSQNPLYQPYSSEAPNLKSEKDKEFVETERGKSFYETLNKKN
jgi:hypothetical protein